MIFMNAIFFYTAISLMYVLKLYSCNLTAKIVGGDFAKIYQFPHSVFINMECRRSTFICGSSILNQRILLTAAHCVKKCNIEKGDQINAFGGNEDYSTKNSVVRKVLETIFHKGYIERSMVNDIALAELIQPFPLNNKIKRVVISKNFPNENEGVVAGWGLIDEILLKKMSILKHVKQRLITRQTCAQRISISAGNLCAGSIIADHDRPSLGDSGSALVASGYKQIALVSFKVFKWPALVVYTNVSFYYDWIVANAERLVCT